MSIKVMSNIWENGPTNQSERFILLALADYANDEGECWPSINGVAKKTCMTDRGVRKILRRLEEQGWLETQHGSGRKNCNIYTIKTPHMGAETLNTVPPERGSPRNTVPLNPERGSLNPERGSPEPSITINKPSVNNTRTSVLEILKKWTSEEAAKSFIAYRESHKSKSLTETAAKKLAASLQEIFNAGHDTDDALGMAEEHGWATIKLGWYENAGGKSHGNGNGETAEQQIARLAGLNESNGLCSQLAGPSGKHARFANIIEAAAQGTTSRDWG